MSSLDELKAELATIRAREAARAAAQAGQGSDEPRRRLTLSDIVGLMLAAQAHGGGEHSSVRLNRNARGDTQIEVTVRTGDSHGIDTASDAAAEALRLYNNLRELFPMGGGDDGNG